MANYVLIGDVIRLNLELYDGVSGKFPRAYLFDPIGVPIAATPHLDLVHVGEGLYISNQFFMPSIDELKVVYVVYNDSGHTQVSRKHCNAFESFNIPSFATIVSGGGRIVTTVQGATIVGTIAKDDKVVGALVKDDVITGELVTEQALPPEAASGVINDTVTGSLESDDLKLVGSLEGNSIVGVVLEDDSTCV